MKFDLQNFSLKTLTYLAFGLLALLSVIHYFSLKSVNSGIIEKNNAIDISRQLRNNTYVILSLANQIRTDDNYESRADLKSVVNRHQGQLSALEFGTSEGNKNLKALEDGPLIALKKASTNWLSLKANISVFLDGEIQLDSVYLASLIGLVGDTPETALKLINMTSDSHINSLNELTKSLNKELALEQDRFEITLVTFLLIELAVFIGLVISIFKFIVAPMTKLGTMTEQLAKGNQVEEDNVSLAIELGVVRKGINKLVHNLSGITNFVKEIGGGNLDVTLERTEEEINQDSLEGALISMRDQMKTVQQEESERKWATEGLAQFVEILRSTDTDVHELGDKIISKLVEYTNSNQGGIYLFNDDEANPALDLISLYAYNHKKYEERTIRIGEGLVGQTYLERKTTYLLEFPDDYIEIVSGLGGANPKVILMVPLMVNDEIYGILEIASFNEYKQHEIEFIEKLCESIASTISGVKVNQRTKVLLTESQQLTEQMQAQEEEMRQNMEELTATQEEMARTDKERFAQQTAIDQNIGIAEYDAEGNLIYSNNEFNNQLGYNKEQTENYNMQGLFGQHITDSFKGFLEKNGKSGPVKTYSLFAAVMVEGERKMVELSISADGLDSEKNDVDDLEKMFRHQLEALDITQDKFDEQVKTFENKLRLLTTAENIIVLNSALEVQDISQAAADSLGLDRKEPVGMVVSELFGGFEAVAGKQVLNANNNQTYEVNVEVVTIADDNEYIIHWS